MTLVLIGPSGAPDSYLALSSDWPSVPFRSFDKQNTAWLSLVVREEKPRTLSLPVHRNHVRGAI